MITLEDPITIKEPVKVSDFNHLPPYEYPGKVVEIAHIEFNQGIIKEDAHVVGVLVQKGQDPLLIRSGLVRGGVPLSCVYIPLDIIKVYEKRRDFDVSVTPDYTTPGEEDIY